MNMIEIERALRQLRLSGIADTLAEVSNWIEEIRSDAQLRSCQVPSA